MGFLAGLLIQGKEFYSFEVEVRMGTSMNEISVHRSFGAKGCNSSSQELPVQAVRSL